MNGMLPFVASRHSRLVWATVGCIFASLTGCGREPFAHTTVSGKVTYSDGAPIPVDGLQLIFLSETPPADAKTHPRPARASVDKGTGAFDSATTHKAGDGLICGKHKVILSSVYGAPLPPNVVPPEYTEPARTPLEVDTEHQPFELTIRKPTR